MKNCKNLEIGLFDPGGIGSKSKYHLQLQIRSIIHRFEHKVTTQEILADKR